MEEEKKQDIATDKETESKNNAPLATPAEEASTENQEKPVEQKEEAIEKTTRTEEKPAETTEEIKEETPAETVDSENNTEAKTTTEETTAEEKKEETTKNQESTETTEETETDSNASTPLEELEKEEVVTIKIRKSLIVVTIVGLVLIAASVYLILKYKLKI